jgi:hypothetical protein
MSEGHSTPYRLVGNDDVGGSFHPLPSSRPLTVIPSLTRHSRANGNPITMKPNPGNTCLHNRSVEGDSRSPFHYVGNDVVGGSYHPLTVIPSPTRHSREIGNPPTMKLNPCNTYLHYSSVEGDSRSSLRRQ